MQNNVLAELSLQRLQEVLAIREKIEALEKELDRIRRRAVLDYEGRGSPEEEAKV
jgi:uncharacterized protein Yka (UPF0111/DUF47 family)